MRRRRTYLIMSIGLIACACGGELSDPDPPGVPPPPGSVTPLFAARIGNNAFDQVVDLATGPDGSVYVTGTFGGSVDFDPGTGTVFLTSLGLADVFLAKYTAAGTLVWAGSIGGTSADTVTSLWRDAAGNLVLGGGFEGAADFDPGSGNQFLTSVGGTDGFVATYSTTGGLLWARRFGGTSADMVFDVSADAAGNAYAGGVFSGQANLLPAAGGSLLSEGSAPDGFVLAFDAGGAVRWAFSIGGVQTDALVALTVTTDGSVAVGGAFRSIADFGPGTTTSQLVAAGGADGFVASYTSAGTIRWTRALSGISEEDVQRGGLAADGSGGVAVAGTFAGTTVFSPGVGSISRTSLGPSDWYAARFDGTGSLQSVFSVGGTGSDIAPRLSVDPEGNLLATGGFRGSVDFDPGASSRILTSLATAGSDAFAARYAPTGAVLWVRSFGEATAGVDRLTAGSAIIPGDQGTALVGGLFYGAPNFGTSTSPFGFISLGSADGFVIRLSATGAVATSPQP
jgi:hypothetical protein